MTYVDLTANFCGRSDHAEIIPREVPLKSEKTRYTGVVYTLNCHLTMLGSYIDFPGHIKETDDGVTAATVDLADFANMDCAVIKLDRAHQPGGITAEDLEKAYGGVPDTKAVIINVLGTLSPFDIPQRSVYLELDAIEWLKKTPCKLLVSDVYESTALCGVFLKLFEAGIATVCEPANLYKLPSGKVKLTVLFPKIPITQLPCAMVAEF